MAKKIVKSAEELAKENLLFWQSEVLKRVESGCIPKNPTRFFKQGDLVRIGNLENVIVKEVFADGLVYAVSYNTIDKKDIARGVLTSTGVWEWTAVFPMTAFTSKEVLSEREDVRLNYYNSSLSSLLHKVYHSGVDFNPDYQRELVWTLEQKQNLIESIMTNVEIGKFAFIQNDYSKPTGWLYEILDGKQRLTALCEYYEDRFEWRGKKFTDLSFTDKHQFTGFPIVYGEASRLTKAQIYRLFVKMNTSGTQVSKEHLEKVKSLIAK